MKSPQGRIVKAFCSAKAGVHEEDMLVRAHMGAFADEGGQAVKVRIYGKPINGSVPSTIVSGDSGDAEDTSVFGNPDSPSDSYLIDGPDLANNAVPAIYSGSDDGHTDWKDYKGSTWAAFVENNQGKKVDLLLQAQDPATNNWYAVDQQVFDDNCPNAPSGVIACSDAGVITTTTKIKDKDHAGPYQVVLYEGDASGGNFVAKPGYPASGKTAADGSLNIDVSGLTGGATKTFYVYIYGVNPSGAKDGNDGNTNTVTCQGANGDCPGDATIAADPKVQVTLTDVAPNNGPHAATTSQAASAPAPGPYEEDDPEQKTDNIRVADISTPSGSPRVVPQHSDDGYQTTTLDYSIYVQTFPYDHNQASVTYDSHYKKIIWTARPTGSQYCSNGGAVPACEVDYPIYSYECTTVTNDDDTTSQSCSWVQTGTYATYGTVMQDYSWTAGSPSEQTKSNTVQAYLMNQCYYRTVNVSAAMQPGTLNPSQQDPTQADFSTTVTVVFGPAEGGPTTGLRNPMSLNLTDTENGHDTLGVDSNITCDSTTGGNFTIRGPGGGPPYRFGSNSNTYTVSCYGRAGTLAGPLHLDPGDEICAETDVQPAEGTLNDTIGDSPDLGPASTDGQTSANNCSDAVNDWPYAHFFGNDVTTGGVFDINNDNCATPAGASLAPGNIAAFVNGSGTLSRGSGAQFAALSEGQGGTVEQFNTAILRNDTGTAPIDPSGLPNDPSGLMFANADRNGNAHKGSLKVAHCVPDYFGHRPADNPTHSNYIDYNFAGGNLSNLANGAYYAPGNITISGGSLGNATDWEPGDDPKGQSLAIYVNGNVTISGNITFSSGARTAKYVNGELKTNIPSLFIIARGNIDIAPNVGEVDGVYIAQNHPNNATPPQQVGGTINTCSTNSGDLFGTCNNQLVIRGAFIAKNVELYRTFGSVRDSATGEYPGIPVNAANRSNCNTGDDAGDQMRGDLSIDCGAEVFIFSPEMFLSHPAIPAIPTNYKFDAISSLSPVL
ncbi:MAG TPA: hypothetical protein VHB51_00230 [Candidatus Saccharimonadales bacterium]|nr:hypothetical protein [Candidatus Saccharimonadales bacterium]